MPRPKEREEAESPDSAASSTALFRFSRVWSGSFGYFPAGSEAELPATVAGSLAAEGMGEVVS